MRTVITVDLDDTLMLTQKDFSQARDWFGDYVSNRYSVDKDTAKDKQKDMSRELLSEYQLSMERFPQSCVVALEELAEDPSEEDLRRVFEIGNSAIKEEYQYRRRGFREGAEELLVSCREVADELILLTAGDNTVQNRKIDALNLMEYFDSAEIVEMNDKDNFLSNISASFDRVVHIGNSYSSDVESAIEAGVTSVYIPQGEWRGDSDELEYEDLFYAEDMDEAVSIVEDLI